MSTLRQALQEAYVLGQTYWQQADSEYQSQWKKADETRAKFNRLVEETCATDDEALLRKCLREFQSFEAGMLGMFDGEFKEIISELRERLNNT